MTSSSRIIRGEDFNGEFVSWDAPTVTEQIIPDPVPDEPVAEADPAQVRQQAWQQGFEEGRQAGVAAGRAELEQQAAVLYQVLASMAEPLQQIDRDVEDEVLTLVTVIAGQLARRELTGDAEHIRRSVREGLAALPAGAVNVQVRLHPADAEVARELLSVQQGECAWSLETDPALQPGDCRVVSDTAQIDGRLDTRLNLLVADLLDGEPAGAD